VKIVKKLLAVGGFIILLTAGACSGESDISGIDGNGDIPPEDKPPTAVFTITPSAGTVGVEFQFDAGASYDPQDPTESLEVRWDFDNDGNFDTDYSTDKEITHSYGNEGSYTVNLEVRDTDGNSDTTTKSLDVIPGNSPTISGTVRFEKVPATTSGLDFGNIVELPVRRLPVQAVRSSDKEIVGETVTDDSGSYSLQAPAETTLYVRVVARMDDGLARVEVKEVYSDKVYSTRGEDIELGTSDITGKNYVIADSNRASGPFNMLDVILDAYLMVRVVNPDEPLPNLVVRWGKDYDHGTYYDMDNQIYILGQRDDDSDEFDDHVIAHEYGHFIAHFFYRDDTIGGPHNIGDKLDVRVAYSEGFANAFSGMALDDPLYIDTGVSGIRLMFNVEDNSEYTVNDGYASEASIFAIFWDLFDANDDNNDGLSYNLGPLDAAWRDPDLNADADLMYLYPFIDELINRNGADQSGIEAILGDENVPYPEPVGNTFVDIALPYSTSEVNIDGFFGGNKYDANHFYRFNLSATGNVRVTTTSSGDIDIFLYRKGRRIGKQDTESGNEILELSLSPGTYVVNIRAWTATSFNYDVTVETF